MSFTDQKPVGTMRNLCEAMGIEWHEPAGKAGLYHLCSCQFGFHSNDYLEKHITKKNPSPTDEAFCWRVLQYMMEQEDWGKFLNHTAEEFYLFQVDWNLSDFTRWLLSDPARFIKMADEWCREHKEVKP